VSNVVGSDGLIIGVAGGVGVGNPSTSSTITSSISITVSQLGMKIRSPQLHMHVLVILSNQTENISPDESFSTFILWVIYGDALVVRQ